MESATDGASVATQHAARAGALAASRGTNPRLAANSSGALQPADQHVDTIQDHFDVLVKIRALGHYPKRIKNASNEKQKAENALADLISKGLRNGRFSEELRSELETLRTENRNTETLEKERYRIEQLMADVRSFGCWPVQHEPSEDPKREAERLLAQRVAKIRAAACLPPAATEELEALEAEHKARKIEQERHRIEQFMADVTLRTENRNTETLENERYRIEQLMGDVRSFGCWPVQHTA